LTPAAKQGILARSPVTALLVFAMKKTVLAVVLTLVISWVTIQFVLFAAWHAQTFFSTLSATGQWIVVGAQVAIGVVALSLVGMRAYRKLRGK
jgi:hypothetical protein